MTFQRNERWFEETLPHLGDQHFKEAFRVIPVTFRYLVESCRSSLERQTTVMKDPISVEKRVAVGLYRLCSTAEDRTIAHLFGIGRSTVNVLFREFCAVVITILEDDWVGMVPPDGMAAHMREFHAVTGFPKAVGALDGCHFPVSPPKESATDYYNYKGWYSMILLALVDHRYRFRYVNVGSPGGCHDAGVYGASNLCRTVGSEDFSSPVALMGGTEVPPIILCDEAFPLGAHLQKPYAHAASDSKEATYNYNLSKTKRIVENAFGRLKARFRFIMKRMECRLAHSKQAIKAACILHNVCESLKDSVEQRWESEARALDALYAQPTRTTQAASQRGHQVRDALANYFWRQAGHTA
ncbi:uncharacterized protein LOC144143334 [Haemaphysalis longicornis]